MLDSWVQSVLKSILRGDPIFESAAWFFVIILKFISTSIFEIKIHEKKFRDTKKILFTKVDFYKAWDSYSSRSQCHTRKSNLVDRKLGPRAVSREFDPHYCYSIFSFRNSLTQTSKPITGSAKCSFVILLKFIMTFGVEIYEKISWCQNNFEGWFS